ncbi:LLM class flavin-dependent oxidoreductase [Erwinia sp. E_sp_B04_7]|uniref:LLM class flavin-dependent oxidoreductase n=1 Tax=unclassified Erwinia TaxID=2622719 RepID=UPI0030D56D32
MPYQLSLLDQSPLAEGQTPEQALVATLNFAREAERLGYHRLWVSEHHNSDRLAGSSPEVLIAWLLAQTSRLRIGSGGVMLQHYSPYKVAENFHLLASLAPGRVDLGVGKAPGGLPLSTQALRGSSGGQRDDFAGQLAQLTHYLNPTEPDPQGLEARALPAPTQPPQRFLLGASKESAKLAATLGWHFVFAGFIATSEEVMTESVLAYHEYASGQGKAVISLAALAAETQEEAASLVAEQHNYRVILGEKHVTVGTPEQAEAFVRQSGASDARIEKQALSVLHGTASQVHQRLASLHQRLNVSEFILHTPLVDPELRLRSIALLANQQ